MKGRILRILVLLWLAWYVWGPVDPVVDFWDSPRQTMSDMVRSANGTVVLIAAGLAIALFQSRNARHRFPLASHRALGLMICSLQLDRVAHLSIPFQPIHSPPVPLRI